jgi:UDP-glucose 4-epimerase
VAMKVLVTGGSGFIGSYLVSALVRNGDEVIVLDNFSTGMRISHHNQPSMFECIEGSILDEELVKNLISKVDKVIHLAAAVGVANIVNSPLLGLRTNVLGSEIVIRNCSKYSKTLLLTSSSEIYGKNDSSSLNEYSDRIVGVPQKSRWSYSDSKAIEEAFALAYHKEQGLDVKIVRLFNTVGPGQLGEYGMVIPRFMRSAIRNDDLEIYGDGKQKRCFMHVDDAVNGILKFHNSLEGGGKVVNLGNPQEITIENLAVKIIDRASSSSRIVLRNYADVYGINFEDMKRRVPDISLASSLLKWAPEKSIDQIIEDVFNFEQASMEFRID